ncbi:MAG TPA: trigger factor [Frankiaceae bacterium]|nr:trigger factor [Frankiaceae bacterium]
MKATKEALSPTRVKVTIEVPFDELSEDLAAAYKRISRQIKVPGFRPGKVPARIVDQRIGRGYVLNEALPGALDRFYGQALEQEQIAAIASPEDVDVKEFNDGEQLVFTAEVDVRPEVTLPELDGIEITVDDIKVSDEDVDEQLQSLRDRFATLQPVERPVADGDYLTIDLSATIDGELVPDSESKGMSYLVGSENLIPGMDEAVTGASEGDERSFPTELKMGDLAGQTAEVLVKVISVKEKELPELDDDFATTASEFDTLDELKADISERLSRVRRYEQGAQARDKLIEKLNEMVDVPLPESAVKAEVDAREHNLSHQLERIGVNKAVYLETEGKTEEEFDAEVRETSETAVKSQLVLDALAEKEELTVEQEELTEHLVRRAQQSGVAPQEFANQIMQSGQIGVIFSEVRRGKALAQLLERIKITDESGNEVDLSALDDDEAAEAAEALDELEVDDLEEDELDDSLDDDADDADDEDPEQPHEHPREEQYVPEVKE